MVRQPSGGMPRALSAALDREMSGQLPPSVVPIVPARPGSGIPGHALELDPARWEPHAPVHGCMSLGCVGVVELDPAQLGPGRHWWRRLDVAWADMTARPVACRLADAYCADARLGSVIPVQGGCC